MGDGVAALLFYIFIYGLMNLGAFAVLSALSVRGEACETFHDLAGLIRRAPALAIAMVVCVFSLMGFPPTAGFLGKVYLFWSAFSVDPNHTFHQPLIYLAIIAVINSAIAAAYYLRIVAACFIGDSEADYEPQGGPSTRLALAACSIAMIVFFFLPGAVATPAQTATTSLTPSQTLAMAK
jgi:NADH-quinone oxidoreductase subunit N